MGLVKLWPFLPKGLGRKTLTHSVDHILLYSSASSDGLTGMDLAVWSQLYKSVFINCYIKYFLIPKSPSLIYMSFWREHHMPSDSSLSLSIVCNTEIIQEPQLCMRCPVTKVTGCPQDPLSKTIIFLHTDSSGSKYFQETSVYPNLYSIQWFC